MRVVFFDLDGTLLESAQEFAAVYARTLRELGLERCAANVERGIPDSSRWFEENVGAYRGREMELWRAFNTRVSASLGAGERAEEAGAAVTAAFQRMDRPTLYDDALPCLDALEEAGLALGVITARPDASRLLEPLGVLDRFPFIADGFASGAAKHDTRSFEFALDLAGVAPADAAHVGDQIERDVLPARATGMTAVLIDRAGRRPDADCLRVESLDALPGLLTEQMFS
jgi:putative hydrolase of the HAD superfamily